MAAPPACPLPPSPAEAMLADASQARDQVDEELQLQDGHGMEPTLAPPASPGAEAADAENPDAAAEAEPSADETCGSAEELAEEGDGELQQQQQQLEEGGEECSPVASCGQAYETVRDYCLARTQVGGSCLLLESEACLLWIDAAWQLLGLLLCWVCIVRHACMSPGGLATAAAAAWDAGLQCIAYVLLLLSCCQLLHLRPSCR